MHHMSQQLTMAREKGDHDKVARIQEIVLQEQQRQQFAVLWHATGQPWGRIMSSIKIKCKGITTKVNTEEEVIQAIISEVHTVRPGQSSSNMQWPSIPWLWLANSISTTINSEDWKHYWWQASEATSSSVSGLHFGHYTSLAISPYLSHFLAAKTTTALTVGRPFIWWTHGVTVMWEKKLGVNLVSKLQAILLMEADFNAANELIFGNRMLQNILQYNFMLEEIFSKKGCTSIDGILAKFLFYDISRQICQPAAIASVDMSNCFDRICHAITSLVFEASGVPATTVVTMLCTIEEMKFFCVPHLGIWQHLQEAASTIRHRDCAKVMGKLQRCGEWWA